MEGMFPALEVECSKRQLLGGTSALSKAALLSAQHPAKLHDGTLNNDPLVESEQNHKNISREAEEC